MSKSKPYEEQKTENQMASEAAMMYETARSMMISLHLYLWI